jgi:sulfur carrier protein ThiS
MSRLHDAARTDAPTVAVTVILSAALRRRRPGSGDGPQRHVLAAGATLGDLLAALGFDGTTDLTAAVNGELADRDTPLHNGAEVMLLVAMEGGAEAAGEATIRRAVQGSCSKPTSAKAVAVDQGVQGRSSKPTSAMAVAVNQRVQWPLQ